MANTLKQGSHIGLNLDDTDGPRVLVLQQKAKTSGLQEGEKEELKQLQAKGRTGI